MNVIKDLGVNYDSGLSFVLHCHEKIIKAYAVLGIIRRNFMYLSEKAFVLLYKAYVRSQLKYANSVWNPYRMGLIKDLEKVQMSANNYYKTPQVQRETSDIKITNITVQTHSWTHD